MSDIVDSLHKDHINMAQITALAARLLDEFEAGENMDFSLIEDVMRYATGYPDTHHHPTEDIVFARLKLREPGMAGALDAIMDEHNSVIELGKQFLEAIEAVEEEALVSKERLIQLGRSYVAQMKRHMDTEEGTLFPAARAHLTDADWEEIRLQIEYYDDPLFGESRDRDYDRLWQLIQSHSAGR